MDAAVKSKWPPSPKLYSLLCALQLMVDISTPASVLDRLSEVLQSHMDQQTTEFKTDSGLVSFTAVGDPLKVQLLVCFDYSHNGESLCSCSVCCICDDSWRTWVVVLVLLAHRLLKL